MAVQEAVRDEGFTVRRLASALGAEVVGLDVGQPLSDEDFAVLRDAMQEHHMLCFRDQHLTDESLLAFSNRWGPLEVFPEADKTKTAATIYNVANVTPEGEKMAVDDHRAVYQKINRRWHTDSSYRYIPSFASIMYGLEELPDDAEGGETEFSNMLMAYDALSPEMVERLEPLHMVHYYEFGRRLYPELPPVTHFEKEAVPPVSHPVFRCHPDRGWRRSLFITTNSGNEISGMSLEDGQALHRELQAIIDRPEFRYSHRWRKNDLVMWDNRVLLHRAAVYDMAKYRRAFRRTTVAGDGPIHGPYSIATRKALGK